MSHFCCIVNEPLSLILIITLLINVSRFFFLGGSPGLVVMGGDLCSKGHRFESWRFILNGHDIFPH